MQKLSFLITHKRWQALNLVKVSFRYHSWYEKYVSSSGVLENK